MGTFEVDIEVGDVHGMRFQRVRALVDTGSTYLRIPRDVLQAVGVVPQEQRPFEVADGRQIQYEIGQAQVRLVSRTLVNVVVFGEVGSAALLGAVTLESFSLGVDLVGQRLVPVVALMM